VRRLLLIGTLLLSACSEPPPPTPLSLPVPASDAKVELSIRADYSQHLNASAHNALSRAEEAAASLRLAISQLVVDGSPTQLALAREAWRNSYSAYLESLAVSGIPVVEPPEWVAAGITQDAVHTLLNSWPMEPGYVDYVEGYALTGIVNDTTLPLSRDQLLAQHRFADTYAASIGYPVIEFLLWGEDGQRPASDYDPNAEPRLDETTPVAHQVRRGEYLSLLGELLQDHLQRLQMRWDSNNGYYAMRLREVDALSSFRAMLHSAQDLIELTLLNRYLGQDSSSPYSQSQAEDVQALMLGLRRALLPGGSLPISTQGENGIDRRDAADDDIDAMMESEGDLDEASDNAAHAQEKTLAALTASDSACLNLSEDITPCREQLLALLAAIQATQDHLIR